jgi:hypothetical protein
MNRIDYIPKSSPACTHFASLFPVVHEHFRINDGWSELTETSFWRMITIIGKAARGTRYHMNPSVQGSVPMKDPSPEMLQIGKGIRPYYYLDASPLNPYANASDEVVIRARLHEDLVRTHARPEFCWPVGSHNYHGVLAAPQGLLKDPTQDGVNALVVDLKKMYSRFLPCPQVIHTVSGSRAKRRRPPAAVPRITTGPSVIVQPREQTEPPEPEEHGAPARSY